MADRNEQSKKIQQGCIGCLGLILGGMLIIVILVVSATKSLDTKGPSSGPTPTSSIHYLNVSVHCSQLIVTVTNNEEWGMSRVKIKLNPGIIGSGYVYERGLFPTGETLTLPVNEFVNSKHERFDPSKFKVEKIAIEAKYQGQPALWEGNIR